ncbi:hypothetical protein SAMN06265795_102568 [Noviherbaspirillum humi]|uniref:Uncharacterized protein n=1 Tax=Noviherbaspirillum humi TaxID=1688639 RepID=A0A239E7W8_9BURK|nr:hypothetical protein SAMN06265795_102568 [Noviherbaspirillum humi]
MAGDRAFVFLTHALLPTEEAEFDAIYPFHAPTPSVERLLAAVGERHACRSGPLAAAG